MPLPTVLMTDTVRSSVVGQSHGAAYLIDLESGSWRKVIDWTEARIDWGGRGGGRGLRGVAFHNGEVYIAASQELFVFDQDFRVKRSYTNRCLGDIHEVFLDAHTLYLASTLYDSVIALDLPRRKFNKGWAFRSPTPITGDPDDPAGPAAPERRF